MEMFDMQHETDWLTRFMDLVTVTGKVDARCALGAPWAKNFTQAGAQEIPYHIILTGKALLVNSVSGATYELRAGDIVVMPHVRRTYCTTAVERYRFQPRNAQRAVS
jgi:AraC family transcriptional activator of mtrCDE